MPAGASSPRTYTSSTLCIMASRGGPTRRDVLAAATAAAGLGLLPRRARAIGPGSRFRFGHLQLGASWQPRPTALRRMAWEIEKRTSVEVDLDAVPTTLKSETLHE